MVHILYSRYLKGGNVKGATDLGPYARLGEADYGGWSSATTPL